MSDNGERPVEATTFFNRGRRYATEIMKENDQLRSKIRRLEQALRTANDAAGRRGHPGGSVDER